MIVGARNVSHLQNNLLIPQINFQSAELTAIESLIGKSLGPLGPVYDLERYNERHRSIMHTNNN